LNFSLPLVNKKSQSFQVASGMVEVPKSSLDQVVAVTVVLQSIPESVEIMPRSSITFEFLTSINYSEPVSRSEFNSKKLETEQRALDVRSGISGNLKKFLC
jgi:hypothetical protein